MSTANGSSKGVGGRPRTFSDDAIFEAVTAVLQRDGYRSFSLRSITRELACSRQTLIHRFGTTDGLLKAYFEWSQARSLERFALVREQHQSPLEGLRARLLMPLEDRPDEIGDRRDMAGQLAFGLEATFNDDLLGPVRRGHELWIEEYARFIEAAIAAGELRPTDPDNLARQLYATAYGAAVFWVTGGFTGTFSDAMEWALDLILAPWMPNPPTADENA